MSSPTVTVDRTYPTATSVQFTILVDNFIQDPFLDIDLTMLSNDDAYIAQLQQEPDSFHNTFMVAATNNNKLSSIIDLCSNNVSAVNAVLNPRFQDILTATFQYNVAQQSANVQALIQSVYPTQTIKFDNE